MTDSASVLAESKSDISSSISSNKQEENEAAKEQNESKTNQPNGESADCGEKSEESHALEAKPSSDDNIPDQTSISTENAIIEESKSTINENDVHREVVIDGEIEGDPNNSGKSSLQGSEMRLEDPLPSDPDLKFVESEDNLPIISAVVSLDDDNDGDEQGYNKPNELDSSAKSEDIQIEIESCFETDKTPTTIEDSEYKEEDQRESNSKNPISNVDEGESIHLAYQEDEEEEIDDEDMLEINGDEEEDSEPMEEQDEDEEDEEQGNDIETIDIDTDDEEGDSLDEEDEKERMLAMEAVNRTRAKKRRMFRSTNLAQNLKKRSIKWLNSSHPKRMHVMDDYEEVSLPKDDDTLHQDQDDKKSLANCEELPSVEERLNDEEVKNAVMERITVVEDTENVTEEKQEMITNSSLDKEEEVINNEAKDEKKNEDAAVKQQPNVLQNDCDKNSNDKIVVVKETEKDVSDKNMEVVECVDKPKPVQETVEKEELNDTEVTETSTITNLPQVKDTEKENPTEEIIPREVTNLKRKRESVLTEDCKELLNEEDDIVQSPKRIREGENSEQKLYKELEVNFGKHDKLIIEYIKNTSSNTIDDIQNHVEKLTGEINTLNDMIRVKETEWNNMIHLKKVKEEIIARLTRKKRVQEMCTSKVGETGDYSFFQLNAEDSNKTTTNTNRCNDEVIPISLTSKILQNAQLSSGLGTLANSKTTQSILQNRANMTSEDLENEKSNTAKLHRTPVPEVNAGHSQQSQSQPAISLTTVPSSQLSSTPATTSSQVAVMNNVIAAYQAAVHQQDQRHSASLDLMNGQQQSAAAAAAAAAALQMGRQGAIKDVKSIIEDYRQKHPETVPRRGRPSLGQQHHQTNRQSKNSLLHGILTKQHGQQTTTNRLVEQGANGQTLNSAVTAAGYGTYSPTLARLLTAPERITATNNFQQSPVINLSKNMKSEITITPVLNSQQQSTHYQQQRQLAASGANAGANKQDMMNMLMMLQDDDQDDSADRLVIDEGINTNSNLGNGSSGGGGIRGQEFHENEVPECQGCKKREAQFVCAGCGNQWYCSRECQVSAWDEHSETCTG